MEGLDLEDKEDKERFEELKNNASEKFSELDWGEFESLRDEIGNWRDGLQGTNLENSSLYSRLEETADILENVVSNLESVSEPVLEGDPDTVAGNVRDAAEEIESAVSDADGCDFPTLYG